MATKDVTETKGKTGKEITQPQQGQWLSPFDELDQWLDEIRRNWMQPFFGRGWPEAGAMFGSRMPRVDIVDRDQEFVVRAELPGVSKENLDVSLSENVLTIRASARREEQEEKGQYFRRELSQGEFLRTIRLPGPIEGAQTKATFKDGILELVVPKAAGTQRQTIKIE
ncbi:Hsp20/alpha crystallin family protein [Methylocaldum sp. BRCS4]|jgi:HSP20 family protein|nr:Hsp20/alpha crystallin family protein [Methylocaldum sp. BRCS4]